MSDTTEIKQVASDVAAKMNASAKAFREQVWPRIQPLLGGAMKSVEGDTDEQTLANILDKCGIDAFIIREAPLYRSFGVASRTLNAYYGIGCPRNIFKGFSIRERRKYPSGRVSTNVEYHKLKDILVDNPDGGSIYPLYTVQAAFIHRDAGESPVYIAMIRTDELIRFVASNEQHEHITRREYQGSVFLEVPSAILGGCPSLREIIEYPATTYDVCEQTRKGVVYGVSFWTPEESAEIAEQIEMAKHYNGYYAGL